MREQSATIRDRVAAIALTASERLCAILNDDGAPQPASDLHVASGDGSAPFADIVQSALKVAAPIVDLVQRYSPYPVPAWWQEVQNRIAVLDFVRNADRHIGVPRDLGDLQQMVDEAYARDPYSTLWLVEGLGYHFARSQFIEFNGTPDNLLPERTTSVLPPESLAMFHAGLGVAVAERCLGSLGQLPDGQAVRDATDDA